MATFSNELITNLKLSQSPTELDLLHLDDEETFVSDLDSTWDASQRSGGSQSGGSMGSSEPNRHVAFLTKVSERPSTVETAIPSLTSYAIVMDACEYEAMESSSRRHRGRSSVQSSRRPSGGNAQRFHRSRPQRRSSMSEAGNSNSAITGKRSLGGRSASAQEVIPSRDDDILSCRFLEDEMMGSTRHPHSEITMGTSSCYTATRRCSFQPFNSSFIWDANREEEPLACLDLSTRPSRRVSVIPKERSKRDSLLKHVESFIEARVDTFARNLETIALAIQGNIEEEMPELEPVLVLTGGNHGKVVFEFL